MRYKSLSFLRTIATLSHFRYQLSPSHSLAQEAKGPRWWHLARFTISLRRIQAWQTRMSYPPLKRSRIPGRTPGHRRGEHRCRNRCTRGVRRTMRSAAAGCATTPGRGPHQKIHGTSAGALAPAGNQGAMAEHVSAPGVGTGTLPDQIQIPTTRPSRGQIVREAGDNLMTVIVGICRVGLPCAHAFYAYRRACPSPPRRVHTGTHARGLQLHRLSRTRPWPWTHARKCWRRH